MLHKGPSELRTPRLLLRRFTPEDAQAMFDNWANDSRVTRYLTWLPHGSPVFTRELLENWCASYERPEVGAGRVGISHAVENPASGRVALKCGLTFEGTRQAAYRTSDGALHDLNVYGIRRDA